MPYRVKDLSTGNYVTTSHAKSVDYKDPIYARVYASLSGARSSARYQQNLHSHWFETEQLLLNRDGKMPYNIQPVYNGIAPQWEVEEF